MGIKYLYIVIFIVFPVFFFLSCSSTTRHSEPFVAEVEELPRTVTILPFSNETSNPQAATAVRKMFYNFFSSLHYDDIEPFKIDSLLKKKKLYSKIVSGEGVPPGELCHHLKSDAIIFGEVTAFGKMFAIIYSEVQVGLKSKMVDCRTGKLIWESHDTEYLREGGIPTNPLGLATTLVKAYVNFNQRIDMKVASLLCMKMIDSIPNPPEISLIAPKIDVMVHNGANKLFKPGEALKVVMIGEPGQVANWDIIPSMKGLPLEEKERGIYIGAYTVKPEDRILSGNIVGYLQSNDGAKSRWIDILGPVYMGEPTPLPLQITEDFVLSSEKSPYIVKEFLIVMPQARIVIEQGAVILFKGLGMIVRGEIEVRGTKEEPVRFMSIDANPWKGIFIDNSDRNNIFSHCEIYDARFGIRVNVSKVNIDNCLFQNNIWGIVFEKGTATIEKSVIRASQKVGISARESEINIKNSVISENVFGGILLNSTKAHIINNNIWNNGEWELKASDLSDSLEISQNWWGTQEKSKIRVVGPVEINTILKESIRF